MAGRTQTSCSFCGKPREEGRRLVAGPGVFICADCVRLCSEILANDARPPSPVSANLADHVDARIVRAPFRERLKGWLRRLPFWRMGGGSRKTPSLPSPQGGGTTS